MNANKKQLQIIHIAKNQMKLDDGTYRETLQYRYGVSSAKDLTWTQADALIDLFKTKGFSVKRKRTAIARAGAVKLASVFQRELIEVLKANVVWHSNGGYASWLEKRMKIKKVVTAQEAFKVIEGLKGMLGIKTQIIELKALPFPVKPGAEKPRPEGWFFDVTKGRLVRLNTANEETACLTK